MPYFLLPQYSLTWSHFLNFFNTLSHERFLLISTSAVIKIIVKGTSKVQITQDTHLIIQFKLLNLHILRQNVAWLVHAHKFGKKIKEMNGSDWKRLTTQKRCELNRTASEAKGRVQGMWLWASKLFHMSIDGWAVTRNCRKANVCGARFGASWNIKSQREWEDLFQDTVESSPHVIKSRAFTTVRLKTSLVKNLRIWYGGPT